MLLTDRPKSSQAERTGQEDRRLSFYGLVEPIAPSQMLFAAGGGEVERRSILLRRCEAERARRPVSVVVVRESAEGAFELAAARDQQLIEALSTVRTKRSATAFAFGARNGVRMISSSSVRKISSKARVNMLSRSWIRKRSGVRLS